MTVRNGVCGTRFDAIAAKNTARIIDVVDASVALPGGNSLHIRVFGGLDVNTTRRTSRGAQEAANALFQSAFITVENVDAAITRLEMDRFFRIIFRDGFPQHIAEGHAKAFY